MRKKTEFNNLEPGDRFFAGPRSRIVYAKLPDSEVMSSDMGHEYPATMYNWAREDLSKFYSHHSWAGNAPDVWEES